MGIESHPADCQCPICVSLRLWPNNSEVRSPGPHKPEKSPTARNGTLPESWIDATEFAIALGMRKDAANRRAIILAATHPRATQEQAVRLMMGSD